MIPYQDFLELCRQRRSIRYFSDQPVSEDDVRKLLDVAHMAPSVENTQPWHFHVVRNKDLLKHLMESSCYGNFIEGAGVCIIVTYDAHIPSTTKETIWNPKELEYSCAAAVTHLLLGAVTLGLGGTWVSLHHGPAHDLLHLQPHQRVVAGVMLGHLKRGEEHATGEHQRRPVKEMFTVHG